MTSQPAGRHFSGTPTRMLVEYLRDRAPEGALEQVLAEAGDDRPMNELLDDGEWSGYAPFRRLFEVAARVLGGVEELADVGRHAPLVPPTSAQRTEMLQALGSPAALLQSVEASGKGLTAVVDAWSEEVDATTWVVHQRFHPGFAPFPEYCAFVSGLIAMTPMLFGFPVGEVVETECQCRGAAHCSLEISWEPVPDETRRAEYFEKRTELLGARLEALHGTVNDLVSADSVEAVLDRIVTEVARAVPAPGHVLALTGSWSKPLDFYAAGLSDETALRVARSVVESDPAGGVDTAAGRFVVPIGSTRAHYGFLCAVDPRPNRFFDQEIEVLAAYASMAAAALDSASALAEARRDATATRVMLQLSTAMAEVTGLEEMAARLAPAVPDVVDCDRVVIALADPDSGLTRAVAIHGYDDGVIGEIREVSFPTPTEGPLTNSFVYADADDAPGSARVLMQRTGTAAMAMAPITVDGEYVGSVIVGVTDGAHRLRDDATLPDRLRGLAAQAASAVRNARLLDQIRHQALHDTLTGLPNRALVLDRVDNMLARARRRNEPAALLFLDLDGFKGVNDSLGHEAGDRLLQAVAARLMMAVRDGDTVGRLGGDEFVVLIEAASDGDDAEVVAARILSDMREPFELTDTHHPLVVTTSIGLAFGDRLTASELLRDADVALYRAKEAGKDQAVCFAPEMHTAIRDQARLQADLRRALEREEFALVYQPIFDLRSRTVTGAEALLRWHHPERGLVQPAGFIPTLEETGLIVDVGRWVIFEACRQAAEFRHHGHDLVLSVNVSARQLETDQVVGDLRAALDLHAIDPHRLIIEITETTLMRDPDATARRLAAIRALGTRVAIDDFGTGYSSLAYIRQFPLDVLKIDRSFVSAMAGSDQADALVHALVQLGKSLGLETLAEGIEEADQFAALQRQECDSGQGFLLARPLEPLALESFLREHISAPVG